MKTCLVVDDSSVIRKVARRILEGMHFEISEAEDGEQALDMCRGSLPDVVFLDLNMPRMDGRELLAEMKKDPELQTIPVVIFTTSDSDQDVVSMYNLHASCYVTKPLDFEQFTKIVKEIKGFWFTIVKLP